MSRTTPLEPNDSPGFLLWHATLRWQRGIAQALAPLDLPHVQFVLLACTWWLNDHGVHPNQVAVAAQAGTDIKMTSQVLRSLERKGLIEREIDSADTRARRLRVTEDGARLAPRAIAIVERSTPTSSPTSRRPRSLACSAALRALGAPLRARSPTRLQQGNASGASP
jgi:DNA-binding MarR family transcriptional regulator